MELQTVVKLDKPMFQVDYSTRLMLLGSCFVENIGGKLEYFKFQADVNPCGIVYNPLSVANTLELLLDNKQLQEVDLLKNVGKWVSLQHHGSFSDITAEACLQCINKRLIDSAEQLRHTDVLIITWGTAWVYRYLETGQIVSNCHKLPTAAFERFRLETDEIVRIYTSLIRRLLELRPQLHLLFTVSPIRHWKDGAHDNQLSKSVLLLAIDQLVKQFPQVTYFPSYEIVMDELRDYRFYAEDMLHISSQGIEYIWERFQTTYISPQTLQWMKRIDKINKTLLHRPIDPNSPAYQELKQQAIRELTQIAQTLNFPLRF